MTVIYNLFPPPRITPHITELRMHFIATVCNKYTYFLTNLFRVIPLCYTYYYYYYLFIYFLCLCSPARAMASLYHEVS
jgi:hypothetical protein